MKIKENFEGKKGKKCVCEKVILHRRNRIAFFGAQGERLHAHDVVVPEPNFEQNECISPGIADAWTGPSVPSCWLGRSEQVRDLPDEADDGILPAVLQYRPDDDVEWRRPRCHSVGRFASQSVTARCTRVQF